MAYQLRLDGGGPGRSQFFSASRYGSIRKAQRAAVEALEGYGLTRRGRGGSPPGRLTRRSRTAAAGIRFASSPGANGPLWRIVATWVDSSGDNRHTSFSVSRHGARGALELAVAARTSAGAPAPAMAPLLKRLKAVMAGTPA